MTRRFSPIHYLNYAYQIETISEDIDSIYEILNNFSFFDLVDVTSTGTRGEQYYRNASGSISAVAGLGGLSPVKAWYWDNSLQHGSWQTPGYSYSYSTIRTDLGSDLSTISPNFILETTSGDSSILITGTNGLTSDELDFEFNTSLDYVFTGDITHDGDLTISSGNTLFSDDGTELGVPGTNSYKNAFKVIIGALTIGAKFFLDGAVKGWMTIGQNSNHYHKFGIYNANLGDVKHTNLTNSLDYNATFNLLGLSSGAGGFILPNMTTTQKNALPVKFVGQIIFDTTLLKAQCWDGTTWNNLF